MSRGDATEALERSSSNYHPLHTFTLGKDLHYQQQFADIYFLRLTKIKPAVEKVAEASWEGTVIGGEKAKPVDRVLDVRQGELCWVTGTVYMDMPLKPNILEDVSKDVSLHDSVDARLRGVFVDLPHSAGSQHQQPSTSTTPRTVGTL